MPSTGGGRPVRGTGDTDDEVVVGVASGDLARGPVRWAARHAREQSLSLRLVRALVTPRGAHPAQRLLGLDPARALRARALADLDLAVEQAHEVAPGLDVRTTLTESGSRTALSAWARSARLVVLGRNRWGRAPGPHSDAAVVCRAAGTPVAVVPCVADAETLGPPDVREVDGCRRSAWPWRSADPADHVVLLRPTDPPAPAVHGRHRRGTAAS